MALSSLGHQAVVEPCGRYVPHQAVVDSCDAAGHWSLVGGSGLYVANAVRHSVVVGFFLADGFQQCHA